MLMRRIRILARMTLILKVHLVQLFNDVVLWSTVNFCI
jgi:hypothetical protein